VPVTSSIPVEFVLFAATLLGIAFFHRQALRVAVVGLLLIALYKVAFGAFAEGAGLAGLALHVRGESIILVNLFALLLGFGLLADHFEKSHVPALLPALLPDNWTGGLVLLVLIFVLSSFLDNIAAALIGGSIARVVFRGKVHIGYLAAIVAASNAGGSGSVVGDTTTTMMWIAGVPAAAVFRAYAGALPALLIFGIPASLQQQRFSPITKSPPRGERLDHARLAIVICILGVAAGVNLLVNLEFPRAASQFPLLDSQALLAPAARLSA